MDYHACIASKAREKPITMAAMGFCAIVDRFDPLISDPAYRGQHEQ